MSSIDYLHESYSHSANLGGTGTVRLFWTLDSSSTGAFLSPLLDKAHELDTIHFAVAYLLPKSADEIISTNPFDDENIGEEYAKMNYWLGFGLSPQGGMIGADMMIYLPFSSGLHSTNSTECLLDVHGVAYSFPAVDQCGQDWELVSASVIDAPTSSSSPPSNELHAWHIVEAKRSLLSNDVNEDLPFIDDSSHIINPTKVIAAWGKLNVNRAEDRSNGRLRTRKITTQQMLLSESIDYGLASSIIPHGPLERVSSTVRFFASDSDTNSKPILGDSSYIAEDKNDFEDMSFIDLIPSEPFLVPEKETTYKNFCFRVDDFPDLMRVLETHEQVHIVAFQNIIDGSHLVHHMDLHGTTVEALAHDIRLCRTYMDLIHPWEAGSPRSFELPQEAGIPLGTDGYRAFRVEVHYHNPLRENALLDSSGVRIYYSVFKRKHVAGLMLLGDYSLKLRGSYTVGSKLKNFSSENAAGMRHSFYCPPSCFSESKFGGNENPGVGVTVFREVLHMHKSGERMINIHLDSNGSIIRASEANRFDFTQGAGYAARADLPYQVHEGDSFLTTCYFASRGVVWGSSSDNEMCQSFLWYYPKTDKSLTCSYFDPIARKQSESINSEDPVGCEMSYDRSEVAVDLERLRPSETCQEAGPSKLSFARYEPIVDIDLKTLPALLQLVNSWKQSLGISKPAQVVKMNNFTAPSSSAKNDATEVKSIPIEDCHLCPGGQRPTQPDTLVKGFTWTCDELDAAIPILYSEPELLYFSPIDVAPCENYRASFGELCGCPKEDGVNTLGSLPPSTWNAQKVLEDFKLFSIGVLLSLALTMLIIKRRLILG